LQHNPNAFVARRIFWFVFILGLILRLGYGVVRYRASLLSVNGNAFIGSWDHDALYHVLIAKAILSGQGYIVDAAPLGRQLRYAGQDAVFKAPLYEYFLAGVFAISGYSFKLLFPLQALLGGVTAGWVGVIGLRVFRSKRVGWIAGFLAAAQPLLVNSASQPYNEEVFYFFYVASILAFLLWLDTRRLKWILFCGISSGLCMLTRENASVLLVAMAISLFIADRRTADKWAAFALIVALTAATVAPWTIRNYSRFGVFVPVASIVGSDFTEGNNDCVASEPISMPYWAEGPCPSLGKDRSALMETYHFGPRVPLATRIDIVSRSIAVRFVKQHPASYSKLVIRRLWTTLLPFNPRGNQRLHEKLVLFLYWLILFPAGSVGIVLAAKHIDPAKLFLTALVVINLLSIMAVLYWSDLRFRISLELPLTCFAAYTYDILGCRLGPQGERREASVR
jgi:4-amino-4-deoxy-L-arabinose transferase-like glycosyltransferase